MAMLALIPIAGRSQTALQNQKATIVLVHAAWADASGFDAVVSQLQKAGNTVYAPPNELRGMHPTREVTRTAAR